MEDYMSMRSVLSDTLPFRKKQWELLVSLLSEGGSIGSIFLYGHTATGKTYVLNTVLQTLELDYVEVNCVEFDTPTLIAAHIAAKLTEIYKVEGDYKKCSNFMDLLSLMDKIVKTPEYKHKPFIIVLERAERLRRMPGNTLQILLKLRDLSSINVTAVLMSDVIWEKFSGKNWFIKPIQIFFPQYSSSEFEHILKMKTPEGLTEKYHSNYVMALVRTLHRFCRNLTELQYMHDLHLPLVRNNATELEDMLSTMKFLSPYLKESSHKLHLREGTRSVNSLPSDQKTSSSSLTTGVELPYYARFVLIAAFLSSYNAPKHDKRLFMKFHGKQRKHMPSKAHQVKMSSLLVGPKSFNFERLAAIFNAIADIPCSQLTNNLCAQLSSLVNLKMISRSSSLVLNDPKYTCAVGLQFITTIGESVHFKVSDYIMEDN